jgi:hypothetical protein
MLFPEPVTDQLTKSTDTQFQTGNNLQVDKRLRLFSIGLPVAITLAPLIYGERR